MEYFETRVSKTLLNKKVFKEVKEENIHTSKIFIAELAIEGKGIKEIPKSWFTKKAKG